MAGSPLSAPPHVRARWFLQVDKYGKSVKEVCSIFGISRKTYYKWYGLDHHLVFRDTCIGKIHPHTKLTPRVKMIIYENKTKYNYGPKKMQLLLKREYNITIGTTTIYKYYLRRRLIRKPQKKQVWYTPLKKPYHAKTSGENVQLDVKYVPGKNMGWSYQYRFIDTASNMQYAIEAEHKDALSTIWAFGQAKNYFPFIISGIQTDNGGEFRGVFHNFLLYAKIKHRYIPKRSAPWNGKVERANRSIDDEYYLNPTKPWNTLSAYVKWYNHERPHLGKGMLGITPYQKYLRLAKKKCNP